MLILNSTSRANHSSSTKWAVAEEDAAVTAAVVAVAVTEEEAEDSEVEDSVVVETDNPGQTWRGKQRPCLSKTCPTASTRTD